MPRVSHRAMGAQEEERKVVTFIDERKKMRIPQRAKPRQTEEPKQKKATFKGAHDSSFVERKSDMNGVHGAEASDCP